MNREATMHRALCTTLLVTCLVSSGCAGDDAGTSTETSGEWRGTITTEGNVTTVVNESGSVWGGTATLVEEASIGVETGPEEYMLGRVISLAASDDRIYVLEPRPPVLRVYDFDGIHVMNIGREGQGPGEFSFPVSVAVAPDGSLFVRDNGNSRFSIFGRDGALLDTWPKGGGTESSGETVIGPDGTRTPRGPSWWTRRRAG